MECRQGNGEAVLRKYHDQENQEVRRREEQTLDQGGREYGEGCSHPLDRQATTPYDFEMAAKEASVSQLDLGSL